MYCFPASSLSGVVYNTARISLSERSRELATLRVIGFTRAEISFILLGELAVLTLAAVPLGLGSRIWTGRPHGGGLRYGAVPHPADCHDADFCSRGDHRVNGGSRLRASSCAAASTGWIWLLC